MSRIIVLSLAAVMVGTVPLAASAQAAPGSVTEYTGEFGQFIVSRDGVSYSLSTGDPLNTGDIVRVPVAGVATVTYDGCTYTIPAGQDVTLDDSFCTEMAALEPTAAELAASETGPVLVETGATGGAGNAPLIIGGIVVAAGGIAAAAGGGGGDDGGTPTSP